MRIECAQPNAAVTAFCISTTSGSNLSPSYGSTDSKGNLIYPGLNTWGNVTSYTCALSVGGANVLNVTFTNPE